MQRMSQLFKSKSWDFIGPIILLIIIGVAVAGDLNRFLIHGNGGISLKIYLSILKDGFLLSVATRIIYCSVTERVSKTCLNH